MTQRFQSAEHALTTGIIMGALLKEGKAAFGEDMTIEPVIDGDHDYQQQIKLSWGGHTYMIDVSEIVIEEDPI